MPCGWVFSWRIAATACCFNRASSLSGNEGFSSTSAYSSSDSGSFALSEFSCSEKRSRSALAFSSAPSASLRAAIAMASRVRVPSSSMSSASRAVPGVPPASAA